MYSNFLKRVIDFTAALLLLIIASPVFLVISVALFIVNDGSVFFTQDRPGYKERRFKVVKFKSMNDKKDAEGNLLPDVERMTKIGSFSRKASLDEIPQLINVLKGDMSLVGPRPLLFKYLPLYNETQKRRHDVRPGITGWAQVNGRNSISWKQKFEFDVYYVDNLSLWFDIKILYKTALKVVVREGVNQSDKRPMMPFDGTN